MTFGLLGSLGRLGRIGGGGGIITPPAPDTTDPTITSSATKNVSGGAVLSHQLTADEFVTWTVQGGVDELEFEISGDILRWAADGTQDFGAPADVGANNVYDVTVRATDTASNTTDQAIAVTVTEPLAGTTGQPIGLLLALTKAA